MMSSRRILFASFLIAVLIESVSLLAAPLPPRGPKDGPLGMKFVRLQKGTFYMGGGGGRAGRMTEIKEDFEIAIHTVTQGQWQTLMGYNSCQFSRTGSGRDKVQDISAADLEQFPVEGVSWDAVQECIAKLNEKERSKGWFYRLPTEAEWEYACRGRATSEEECSFHFYFAKPTNDLSSEQANFYGDRPFGHAPKGPNLDRTSKVGSYIPNKLGLYDMHGNVLQWCADLYGDGSPNRVIRGGFLRGPGSSCRTAERSCGHPTGMGIYVGFRLVRVPSGSK